MKINPFRQGDYGDIFEFWQKQRVCTKSELIQYGVEKIGLSSAQSYFNVTAIISPRNASDRGDCRGSVNVPGHLYYAEKLARKWVLGVREAQRFQLRWRESALAPREKTRPAKCTKQENIEYTI